MSQPTSSNYEEEIAEVENSRSTKDLTPAERFFRHFQDEVSNIEALISNLKNASTSDNARGDAVDYCLSSIAHLNQEVQDASSYIPAYDQRTYGESIKRLGVRLADERTRFEPKKKFAFKSKAKVDGAAKRNESTHSASSFATVPGGPGSSTDAPSETKQDEVISSPTVSYVSTTGQVTPSNLTLFDESNQHILKSVSSHNANGSGTLSMLTHCIVDMVWITSDRERYALQTLTLKTIKDSLLLCSHVHGAAHLTDLTNSIVVVASRQFRMHNSHNCDVYLLTTSRPIIEDCTGIHFAPLPETYMTTEDEGVENQWQNVDDFKWLRAEQSPNWSILPEQQRINKKVWKEVVPGSPKYGLEEILRAVGITK